MDHDVGALNALVDVPGGLVEIATDVEGLVVLGRHIEEVGDFGLGMSNLYALGGSEEGADLQF